MPASGEVFTSETVVPATTVACQEINGNASILSDYELVIEWSDTMVTNKYAKKLASTSYIYMCIYMSVVCSLQCAWKYMCIAH